jgi:hypothetical protein
LVVLSAAVLNCGPLNGWVKLYTGDEMNESDRFGPVANPGAAPDAPAE